MRGPPAAPTGSAQVLDAQRSTQTGDGLGGHPHPVAGRSLGYLCLALPVADDSPTQVPLLSALPFKLADQVGRRGSVLDPKFVEGSLEVLVQEGPWP
jgi:hypothetical protein